MLIAGLILRRHSYILDRGLEPSTLSNAEDDGQVQNADTSISGKGLLVVCGRCGRSVPGKYELEKGTPL